jgi:hypothetical protein
LAGRQRGTLNSFNPHLSTIHSSAFLIQAWCSILVWKRGINIIRNECRMLGLD